MVLRQVIRIMGRWLKEHWDFPGLWLSVFIFLVVFSAVYKGVNVVAKKAGEAHAKVQAR